MISVLPKDAIVSIDTPVFVTPAETRQMMVQERVVGVEVKGERKAYPLNVLSVHEIINDCIGGEPVAVTWSPLSYSAIVYKRTVVDRPLLFGGSGSLLRNVLVIYDRQTGTYWNQLTGDAFAGALSGFRLEAVPSVLTTWGSWLRAHPSTQVLCKEQSPFEHYDEDHMQNYYVSDKTGIREPARRDLRLAPKEIILGVASTTNVVAYPLTLLKGTKVLHDETTDGTNVIFYDDRSQTATVFCASLDSYTLTFYERSGVFYDYQTGSRWLPQTGICRAGPFAGKRLDPLSATTAFWFAWADHYPDTRLYSLPAIN